MVRASRCLPIGRFPFRLNGATKAGKALRDHRGKLEPVKAKETLRFAHSHDLHAAGDWHLWQHECFQAERMQPFKQVFRELYVVTKQEKKDGAISHRYDGQQVQPKQALALFGSRGWNTADGVFKVFHDEGLTVQVGFDGGVTTPAEVISKVLLLARDREIQDPVILEQLRR